MSDFWSRRGFLKCVVATVAAFIPSTASKAAEVIWLSPHHLRPGGPPGRYWNSSGHMHGCSNDALEADININGILEPLWCVREEGHYKIVDGDRRWYIAMRRGIKQVPVKVL